jgi:hypothetical protein
MHQKWEVRVVVAMVVVMVVVVEVVVVVVVVTILMMMMMITMIFNTGLDAITSRSFWAFPGSYAHNGYRGLFLHIDSGRGIKLATHTHLVASLRMRRSLPPLHHTYS